MKRNISFRVLILVLVISMFQYSNAQHKNKFKIVLDAGHGGKDPGNSYHGYIEKHIALATTLLVGKKLDAYSDIEILYTRKSDVFIELSDRPKLANENNADLFLSIHCNSVKNLAPFGTETFVMGLNRSTTNLEVAKQENSVILLEKDYKEKYNGFDPNKPESLIGLKILQEEYLDQSIALAGIIENKFTKNLKRNSRGVKQSPLWVLDASYMPSVLIELGFLSNKSEGSYLNSDKGKEEMAQAIVDAVLEYKKEYFNGESTSNTKTVTYIEDQKDTASSTSSTKTVTSKGIVFKVQIAASGRKLETKSSNFKGLRTISREHEGSLYKYFYGNEDSYDDAQDRLKEAKTKGYSSAFIVAYKDGVKINVSDAIK